MAAKGKEAAVKDAEADAADGEEGAAPRKSWFSLKMIIIAVGALVVLAGVGTASFLYFGGSREKTAAAPAPKPVVFFDLPEVLVNLSTTGTDRNQYLKVKVVLELPDQAMQPQIQTAMPRVLDTFQTFLREMRPSDLDGSAGLYRLKEELTRRVNASIAPNKVNAVLFKEIVVQ